MSDFGMVITRPELQPVGAEDHRVLFDQRRGLLVQAKLGRMTAKQREVLKWGALNLTRNGYFLFTAGM